MSPLIGWHRRSDSGAGQGMMKQLFAFDDPGLNASLATILGLEQDTLSAEPEHRSHGWSLIPPGLRSSRAASTAVAASLAAMACGFLTICLSGGYVDRIEHRGEAITASHLDTLALPVTRIDLRPVPSSSARVSGPSSLKALSAASSSLPRARKLRRLPAEGADSAGTSSTPDASRQSRATVPARLHPDVVASPNKPVPASLNLARLTAATPAPSGMLEAKTVSVKAVEKLLVGSDVAAKSPAVRVEARRESVSAIRSLRRQW